MLPQNCLLNGRQGVVLWQGSLGPFSIHFERERLQLWCARLGGVWGWELVAWASHRVQGVGKRGSHQCWGQQPPVAVQLQLPESGFGIDAGRYRLLCASESVFACHVLRGICSYAELFVFCLKVTVRFSPFY